MESGYGQKSLAAFLGVIAFAGLLGVFLWPVIHLFAEGLNQASDLSFWLTFWHDPLFLRAFFFTYGQALLSALLSGVIGTIGAMLYTENTFPGKNLFWKLSVLPFSLPTVLGVMAFISLWKIVGIFPLGLIPILCVHVFFNQGLFVKTVGTALLEIDRSLEKTALSLGASRLRCFLMVTLPSILPAISYAFFLSFLYCSSSFLIVLLLGGGPRYSTLEVLVYESVKVYFDSATAVRLALIQISISLLIYVFVLGKARTPTWSREGFFALYPWSRSKPGVCFAALYFVIWFLVVLGPLVTLVGEGFYQVSLLDYVTLVKPSITSLTLAFVAAAFSLALAFCCCYCKRHLPITRVWIAVLCGLPVSLSTIVFTLALMTTYPSIIFEARGSLVIIAVIQAVSFLPLVFSILDGAFGRVSDIWYKVARSFGASAVKTLWLIELPLLRHSLFTASLVAFSASLGEVGTVMMLSSEGLTTLPYEIYRGLSSYRFSESFGLGAVLLVLALAVHLIADKITSSAMRFSESTTPC